MSKAEEKAVRAYTDHEGFTFKEERKAFVKGYEQAEKDILEWMEENLIAVLDGAGDRSEVISAFKKHIES